MIVLLTKSFKYFPNVFLADVDVTAVIQGCKKSFMRYVVNKTEFEKSTGKLGKSFRVA